MFVAVFTDEEIKNATIITRSNEVRDLFFGGFGFNCAFSFIPLPTTY